MLDLKALLTKILQRLADIGDTINVSGTVSSLSSSTSIAEQTGTRQTLDEGTWIITATVRYSNSSTGYRGLNLFADGTAVASSFVRMAPISGNLSMLQTTLPIKLTADTTIGIGMQQNAGSAMSNVAWYMRAVRIA